MQIKQALNILVDNHGIFANCYIKQKALVDAVESREY